MDKIAIPEQDVVPLESFARGITGARVLIVNVYGVSISPAEWVLIDCGLPHSAAYIKRWAENRFGTGTRPRCILLTHGHFDHTGAVEDLIREWDVRVYAHPLEMPHLTGKSEYPPPDPSVGGGLMALLSKMYPRGPVDISDAVLPLQAGGGIPELPGWRWIHNPGHTEGHVSFFREEDGVLIAGDAFATTKQESFMAAATQRPELHGPPAYFTTDWDAARDSVAALAALRPAAVAAGHGLPLAGPDVAEALATLARDFDRVARPEHGRYVNEPTA